MKLDEKMTGIIIDYLLEKLSPSLLMVFGSFAGGRAGEKSDVDIGFLSDRKFAPYELFMTAQGLAARLGRDVDLVDLAAASTVLQAQAVGKGKVIYCSDEAKRKLFAITVFKKYARLNEERLPVLKKAAEGGSIYGG